MLGVFTLAAGELAAGLLRAPVPPRITPPTAAAIRAYTSGGAILLRTGDATIAVRTSDATIGPTLG